MKKLTAKNRIRIGRVLILFLPLILGGTGEVRGQGNQNRQSISIPKGPESPGVQQISLFTQEQGLTRGYQYGGVHTDAFLYLLNGKRYFTEGVLLNEQQNFSGAAEKFKEALRYLEKSDHIQSIALTHLNLAVCLQTLRDRPAALYHFETALDISRKYGFLEYEAKALQGSGLILNAINRKEDALILLDEAIAVHRRIYDISAEAVDWLIKGIIESSRDPVKARSHFEAALWIAKEIGDPVLAKKTRDYLDQLRNRSYQNRANSGIPRG